MLTYLYLTRTLPERMHSPLECCTHMKSLEVLDHINLDDLFDDVELPEDD
jgi:hypothetical protein